MLVSIIVVNQNRAAALERCLASIERQSFRPLEVIVLDHQSSDGSREVAGRFRDRMRLGGVRASALSSARMGVAASRNLASRSARGDLLCFMDNDACFGSPDELSRCVDIFLSTPSCALVTFRLLDRDSELIDGTSWIYRRPCRKWSDRPFRTFTFTGGGFCVRTRAFREAGGFWDRLVYSREEEDLALELIDRGWEIIYSPSVTIRHYSDPAGRRTISQKRRVQLLNGTLVIWRRIPLPLAFPAITARLSAMTARAFLKDRVMPSGFFSAVREAFGHLRSAGAERRPVSYRTLIKYIALHLSGQV